MTPVERSIEHIKNKLQAVSDKEVAERLGIDASTVAAWRRRGSVPPKYIGQANAIADRLNAGEGALTASLTRLREVYAFALVGSLSNQISERWLIGIDGDQSSVMIGRYLRAAFAFYTGQLRREGLDDTARLRAAYEKLRQQQAGDLVWLETLPDPMTI